MLNFAHIHNVSGWSAPGDGTVLGESVRLDFVDGTSRQATAAEILAARQLSVIEQINAERNRREQTSFPYLGKQIDSDPVSVQRITVATNTAQMALAAGVPYEVQWVCADNSILTLDAMGVLGMMQALGSYGLSLHMYSRSLKAQVLASDAPESVDILTGWPE